ncbi:glycosyltransferase family 39 protein [Roseomonas sp. CCTCC AB2023176]|uniref:glycosyltransferase family 39 protein n=1 Tax=Roseomonas sp. CCTCC AB2023176 TaxID=3342640 RepID=UPI0035E397AE
MRDALGRGARGHRGDGRWWLAVGAFAGAALASKYTAAFLGFGLVLWLVLDPAARRWWRDPRLYFGGAIALLVFAPVIAWNAAHGWASFLKQGGRAAAGSGLTLRFLGELAGGQLLIASPLLFAAVVFGAGRATRAWLRRDAAAGLVLLFVLPAAALFLWQATGSRVQGNWPAILYPAGCLLAAAFVRPGLLRAGAVLGLAMTALVAIQAVASPLPLPRRSDPVLARLGGWPALARDAEAARQAAGATFIAAEEYGLAAELALHAPRGVPVVALGDRWALFRLPAPAPGDTGILVHSTRRGLADLQWPGAGPAGEIVRARDGIEAERYRLFLVRTPPGILPAATLPRPR